MPDDDAEVDAHDDEDEEDQPEAKLGALGLLTMVPVGATPGSMQLVRPLDDGWIELKRLVDHFWAASGLGHRGSVNPSLALDGP